MLKVLITGLFLFFLCVNEPTMAQSDEAPFPLLQTTSPYGGALNRVAFSPNGQFVAVGGRDNRTYLYDFPTRQPLRQLDPMNDWVSGLAFSPDSTLLATGSRQGVVWLWDVATGAITARYFPTVGEITSLAFSPDGTILATASRDSTVALYYLPTQTEFAKLENFGGAVWDIAFTKDGEKLASASEDGTIWLWGLWDGTLSRLRGHTAPVASIAFNQTGTRLLSGSLDGTVRLWELSEAVSDVESKIIMSGHIAPILGVTFSGDERVAFSASLDGTIRVWDIQGVVKRGREMTLLKTNAHPLIHLALSPDFKTLASVGTDGNLAFWQVDNAQITRLFAPYLATPSVVQARPTPTQSAVVQSDSPPPSPAIAQLPTPFISSTGRNISIPSANISSAITTFPLGRETWDIDPYEHLVGHFQGTAWMDKTGNIVLGAHSEYPDGKPGTFYNLYNVGIGDEILLNDNGAQRRYIVVNILSVDYRDVSVVYPTAHNRLTLITCDIPSYVQEQNMYYARLVIVADLIP